MRAMVTLRRGPSTPARVARVWIVYLGAGLLAAAAYVVLPTPGKAAVVIAASLSAALAIAAGIRLFRPAEAAPWVLMGIAQLLWAIGWPFWEERILATGAPPDPSSPIILFFLFSYPFLIAALLLLATRREGGLLAILDVGIIASALAMIAWASVISDHLAADSIARLGRGFQLS